MIHSKPARRPFLLVAALLTVASCSAAAAEVGPSDVGDESATDTTDTTEIDHTTDSPSSIESVAEGGTSTTAEARADSSSTSPTAPETTPETAPTTAAPTTDATTTTTSIEPVPLPERVIAPVGVRQPPLAAVGTSNGEATGHAQWRLLELGFWLEDADGRYDNTTRQAVMAFQKYYGLEADGVLGPVTADVMTNVTERPQGRSNTGTLVEVDKSKQLVFVIREGVVDWIFNASTGTEVPYDEINKNTGLPERGDSVTRTGVFAVNRERAEGWWEGDLGEIYRPKYFDGGIALHGSNNIPAYPASHGCVRLSTDAMDWIWDNNVVPMGTTVWVHGEIPA